MPELLFEADLHSLPLRYRGKVRDIYTIDEQHMLIVASDRISAFDVILPTPIPNKGEVLTSISNFWFDKLQDVVRNHTTQFDIRNWIQDERELLQLQNRSVIVRRLEALPVEAIVRGYIIGSGWNDYQHHGKISGIDLPAGLRQAQKLPEPIFTPSTKAKVGEHDVNVNFKVIVNEIGEQLAECVRDISVALYTRAAHYALERDIIIADTKFEFGLDEDGELYLIDEALTPDSSRFWPVDQYQLDCSPPSFDKQYVRDYLETLDWNKTAPGPQLPQQVIENTAKKYLEAKARLLN